MFDFASREVRDVMVPAPDVTWFEASLTAEDALSVVAETSHSRYPVGTETLDTLVGVVHVRDLLASRDVVVRELARPAHVVPETKDLGALLRELRERHEAMAVVVDEYGDTSGIVTLHDVLEEIVGDIENEYDLPSSEVARVDDRTVEVAGSMTIDDFNEETGAALPQRGPRTLAGLTFDASGAAAGAGRRGRGGRGRDPRRGDRRPAHHAASHRAFTRSLVRFQFGPQWCWP